MPTNSGGLHLPYVENIAEKTFSFFGEFSQWKGRMLSRKSMSPASHVSDCGAKLSEKIAKDQCIVIGDKRGKGKTSALRTTKMWLEKGESIQVLNEHEFHYFIRPDLTDIPFFFTGKFNKGPAALKAAPDLLQDSGAIICDQLSEDIQVIVIGDGREKGKTQALRDIDKLLSSGWRGHVLDEVDYLNFATLQKSPTQTEEQTDDLLGLALQLRSRVDERRLDRAIAMLKKEAFEIYADVATDQLSGVIKSQTTTTKIYAPWITANGKYGCQCFPNNSTELEPCMGLQGHICKHILTLLLGLGCSGEVEPMKILQMVSAVGQKSPDKRETEISAQILLRYKGAEAGEVDWRPVETVPEDFYVL